MNSVLPHSSILSTGERTTDLSKWCSQLQLQRGHSSTLVVIDLMDASCTGQTSTQPSSHSKLPNCFRLPFNTIAATLLWGFSPVTVDFSSAVTHKWMSVWQVSKEEDTGWLFKRQVMQCWGCGEGLINNERWARRGLVLTVELLASGVISHWKIGRGITSDAVGRAMRWILTGTGCLWVYYSYWLLECSVGKERLKCDQDWFVVKD